MAMNRAQRRAALRRQKSDPLVAVAARLDQLRVDVTRELEHEAAKVLGQPAQPDADPEPAPV